MPKFSQDLFNKICERISEGESLRSVCRDKEMPSVVSVMKWLNEDEAGSLINQYTRATEERAANIFEDCLDIADKTKDDPQDRRVRIDTRKWMLGKMQPKKYGDRIQHATDPEGFKVIISDKDAAGF